MSIINVAELAYCRMQSPDLDVSETFLTDFGLIPAKREPDRRFYRGTGDSPYCYILEAGPSHFKGMAFHANTRADLSRLAEATGNAVEPIDGPGGGWRVRLQEPNGYDVDVVFGIAAAEPIPVKRQISNTGNEPLLRRGELFRLDKGKPTPIKRLAHVVLGTSLLAETMAWFKDTLGLIATDNVTAGPDAKLIASFMRVNQGDDYVDHHSVFFMASPKTGLNHISFESQDFDAVLHDHHLLHEKGYEQLWGVGRHLLGSQVFDYWSDPFGYAHEHWADSDRLNASAATNTWDVRDGMTTQWGEEPPQVFKDRIIP